MPEPALPGGAPLGRITRVQAWALRAPIAEPVRTSFGVMRDRPAVWLCLTGADGRVGWGEVWCNFPNVGAEHRARLVVDTLAPLVLGVEWPDPGSLQTALQRRLRVLSLQTGEPGPIAQAIAGTDAAAWDLCARRSGLPLWRLLGGQDPQVGVYASGINPDQPLRTVERMRAIGYRAFKLKVGFDIGRDLANVRHLRQSLAAGTPLMLDANQAWRPDEAARNARALAEYQPLWLEEPIAADEPWSAWQDLAANCPIPLAGGENLRDSQFDEAIRVGAMRFIQPDVGKWGGVTGCLRVARAAQASGLCYCPHWLGGAIGLMASLHLKAAAGGAGWVEIDANPNLLREDLLAAMPAVQDGRVTLTSTPGIGIDPSTVLMARYRSWSGELS